MNIGDRVIHIDKGLGTIVELPSYTGGTYDVKYDTFGGRGDTDGLWYSDESNLTKVEDNTMKIGTVVNSSKYGLGIVKELEIGSCKKYVRVKFNDDTHRVKVTDVTIGKYKFDIGDELVFHNKMGGKTHNGKTCKVFEYHPCSSKQVYHVRFENGDPWYAREDELDVKMEVGTLVRTSDYGIGTITEVGIGTCRKSIRAEFNGVSHRVRESDATIVTHSLKIGDMVRYEDIRSGGSQNGNIGTIVKFANSTVFNKYMVDFDTRKGWYACEDELTKVEHELVAGDRVHVQDDEYDYFGIIESIDSDDLPYYVTDESCDFDSEGSNYFRADEVTYAPKEVHKFNVGDYVSIKGNTKIGKIMEYIGKHMYKVDVSRHATDELNDSELTAYDMPKSIVEDDGVWHAEHGMGRVIEESIKGHQYKWCSFKNGDDCQQVLVEDLFKLSDFKYSIGTELLFTNITSGNTMDGKIGTLVGYGDRASGANYTLDFDGWEGWVAMERELSIPSRFNKGDMVQTTREHCGSHKVGTIKYPNIGSSIVKIGGSEISIMNIDLEIAKPKFDIGDKIEGRRTDTVHTITGVRPSFDGGNICYDTSYDGCNTGTVYDKSATLYVEQDVHPMQQKYDEIKALVKNTCRVTGKCNKTCPFQNDNMTCLFDVRRLFE